MHHLITAHLQLLYKTFPADGQLEMNNPTWLSNKTSMILPLFGGLDSGE